MFTKIHNGGQKALCTFDSQQTLSSQLICMLMLCSPLSGPAHPHSCFQLFQLTEPVLTSGKAIAGIRQGHHVYIRIRMIKVEVNRCNKQTFSHILTHRHGPEKRSDQAM